LNFLRLIQKIVLSNDCSEIFICAKYCPLHYYFVSCFFWFYVIWIMLSHYYQRRPLGGARGWHVTFLEQLLLFISLMIILHYVHTYTRNSIIDYGSRLDIYIYPYLDSIINSLKAWFSEHNEMPFKLGTFIPYEMVHIAKKHITLYSKKFKFSFKLKI